MANLKRHIDTIMQNEHPGTSVGVRVGGKFIDFVLVDAPESLVVDGARDKDAEQEVVAAETQAAVETLTKRRGNASVSEVWFNRLVKALSGHYQEVKNAAATRFIEGTQHKAADVQAGYPFKFFSAFTKEYLTKEGVDKSYYTSEPLPTRFDTKGGQWLAMYLTKPGVLKIKRRDRSAEKARRRMKTGKRKRDASELFDEEEVSMKTLTGTV
jgi:hypothetical protein